MRRENSSSLPHILIASLGSALPVAAVIALDAAVVRTPPENQPYLTPTLTPNIERTLRIDPRLSLEETRKYAQAKGCVCENLTVYFERPLLGTLSADQGWLVEVYSERINAQQTQ